MPGASKKVTPETFRWHLDWERIREARAEDEDTYLLRTNLTGCDPRTLWQKYMIQGEIDTPSANSGTTWASDPPTTASTTASKRTSSRRSWPCAC